ncbi:hypothetical protein [Trinickia acidisoli]|uniref:hypothetical protein n=1 Tax=Trinickia acidisoli TaxID=2767482 RepID=UPI001A8F69B2|nr:hypothetical protein [Trinickia acidisoli]
MNARLAPRRACAATALAACFAALAAPASAWAQTTPVVTGDATISSGALAGSKGVLSVNEAAGLDNAQSNQAAIVAAPSGGVDTNVAQSAQAHARVPSAQTSIEDGALSNVSGVAMVNQAAGAANLQRNSVVLGAAAIGVESVSDSELSAASPKQGRVDVSAMGQGERAVRIGNDVLKNASGIAQINQTAGAGNTTANSFVLRPPAGTFF